MGRNKLVILFFVLGVAIWAANSIRVSTPLDTDPTPISPMEMATSTQNTAISSTTPIAAVPTTTPKISEKQKPVAAKPLEIPTETQPTVQEPAPNFEEINVNSRKAIVNILCTTKGGELSPISGTGIVVSKDGLILTNAHVAQYFLLKNYLQKDFLECIARTGSPAYPKYRLELVYISPTWVSQNKAQLKDSNPQSTGENDFAFVRITSAIDGSSVGSLPFLQLNSREEIDIGEPVLLASYPAGFLGGLSILQDLNLTSAIANISDVFTFKSGYIDVVAIPGTVVSQKGSSGGAVVDKYTSLIGIISTTSDGKTTSDRTLNAVTVAYINRSLKSDLGMSVVEFSSQDIASFAKKFQEINAPSLTKLITDALNKN